jgi:hypothetical protein
MTRFQMVIGLSIPAFLILAGVMYSFIPQFAMFATIALVFATHSAILLARSKDNDAT